MTYNPVSRSPLNVSSQAQPAGTSTNANAAGPNAYQRQTHQYGSASTGTASQQNAAQPSGSYNHGTQNHSQEPRATQPSAPVTVNPTQIYDPKLEIQRQAAKRQAETKRKAEEAAQKEEEARRQAETNEHVKGVEEAQRLAKEGAMARNPSSQKPKKPRKSKKSAPVDATNETDPDASTAAMTLMQTANSISAGNSGAKNNIESQMKAMFLKMREFNKENPDLLAKLWHEEHEHHMQTVQKDQESEGNKVQQTQKPTVNNPKASKKAPASKPRKAKSKASQSQSQSQRKAPAPARPVQAGDQPNKQNRPNSSPSQGQPTTTQQPKAPGTVWPADKKGILAQVASELIMKMPANRGKTITKKEIASILDMNPSYVDLCKIIEDRGFKLVRAVFAKSLLSAVPSGNKSHQAPPTASTNNDLLPPAAPSANGQRTMELTKDHLMNGGNVVSTPPKKKSGKPTKDGPSPNGKKGTPKGDGQAPQSVAPTQSTSHAADDALPAAMEDEGFEGLEAVKNFVERGGEPDPSPSSTKQSKAPRPKHPKPSLPPVPQTKEELARKRTFGDLVDLTQLSDNEKTPPSKRLSINGAGMGMPVSQQQPEQKTPHPAPISHPAPTQQLAPPSIQPPPQVPSPVQQIPKDHPVRNIQVAASLDKHRALRRSTYNSRTIARDVLLSTGRHPEMRHLNAHLDQLRTAFQSLNHLAPIDLSTFRWDVVDPGGAAPGSGAAHANDLTEEADAGFEADADESDTDSVLGSPHRRVAQVAVAVNGGTSASAGPHTPGTGPPQPKKKGRPRIYDSDPPARRHTGRNPPGSGVMNSSKPPPQSTGGAPSSTPRTGGGYAALRNAQSPAGEPVKHRGRPVGWRKYMQKNPPAGGSSGTPSTGNKVAQKQRGGAAESKKPIPEPKYQVYHCRWTRVPFSGADGFDPPGPDGSFKECKAELHNLATLRRHVQKVHGKADEESGRWKCHWEGCGRAVAVRDGPRTTSRIEAVSCRDGEEWKDHVEDEHIKPVAWELGDGPKGGVSDVTESEVSDAYLSDRAGRRVTPRVRLEGISKRGDGEAGEGAAAAAPRHPPRPAIKPGRKSPTAEEKARLEEWEVQERRRLMGGPGIDRQGATLATEKRRRGFVDDDGDVVVVSDDE